MNTLQIEQTNPDHSIIDQPATYQIVDFSYHNNLQDWWQSTIDMTLQRDGTIRRLRFLSPRSLEIEKGFPLSTGGMVIKDVRHQQLAGVGVYVGPGDSSWGAITFWARDVIDLDIIKKQLE